MTKHFLTTDYTDSIRIDPRRLKQSELPFRSVRIRVYPCNPWLEFRGWGVNAGCSS